jgi:LEA14-like dessication related protein
MKFSIKFLYLIGVVFIFNSCKNYENIRPPTVEKITGFTPGAIKDGNLNFSFTTIINNPDLLKFKVKHVDLELLFNGTRIAEVKSKRTIRVKGEIKPEIKWDVVGNIKPMLSKPGALFSSLLSGKVNFQTKGTITISKCLYSKTIPVDLKIPIQIPVN